MNCNYTNARWQKSHPEHTAEVCIMHVPEASLLSPGTALHRWPALSRRQHHAGTHISNSCYRHSLSHFLSSSLPQIPGIIFLKFSAFVRFLPRHTEKFISGFVRIIV